MRDGIVGATRANCTEFCFVLSLQHTEQDHRHPQGICSFLAACQHRVHEIVLDTYPDFSLSTIIMCSAMKRPVQQALAATLRLRAHTEPSWYAAAGSRRLCPDNKSSLEPLHTPSRSYCSRMSRTGGPLFRQVGSGRLIRLVLVCLLNFIEIKRKGAMFVNI